MSTLTGIFKCNYFIEIKSFVFITKIILLVHVILWQTAQYTIDICISYCELVIFTHLFPI